MVGRCVISGSSDVISSPQKGFTNMFFFVPLHAQLAFGVSFSPFLWSGKGPGTIREGPRANGSLIVSSDITESWAGLLQTDGIHGKKNLKWVKEKTFYTEQSYNL